MLADSKAFTGFSVDDLDKARSFYGETLGLPVEVADEMPLMRITLGGDRRHLVYAKPDHQPATFTVLNFPVTDVDEVVDECTRRGVTFERYEGFGQDEQGRHAWPRPDDRVVHRSVGQHPVGRRGVAGRLTGSELTARAGPAWPAPRPAPPRWRPDACPHAFVVSTSTRDRVPDTSPVPSVRP